MGTLGKGLKKPGRTDEEIWVSVRTRMGFPEDVSHRIYIRWRRARRDRASVAAEKRWGDGIVRLDRSWGGKIFRGASSRSVASSAVL